MPELTPKLGIKKPLGNEAVKRANFNENWDIIDANVVADKGSVPSIQAGPDASKPAAGTAGRLYVATDTQIIYRDTGTAWAKVGVVKWGDIDGKPSSFPPSAHTHAGSDITSKVASASAADTVPWNGVSGKPSSFPPSAHKSTHATGGTDALSPTDIGAASAADLAAHLADKAPHPNIPAVRVYHSVAQSIANVTDTYLAFDSERFDTDNMHDTAINNSRLTCNTAGKYYIAANIQFDFNTSGIRQVGIVFNRAAPIALLNISAASCYATVISLSCVYDLKVGDYVEVRVHQNSGSALNVASVPNVSPEFMMVRVG